MQVPSENIISMLRLILENNIFSFSEKLYSQEEGTSMGPRHSPHFADIFMAENIDQQIEQIFQKYESQNVEFLQRFLDDILKCLLDQYKICTKSSKRLIQFILALNSQWLIQCQKIHLHNVTVHTKNQSHT